MHEKLLSANLSIRFSDAVHQLQLCYEHRQGLPTGPRSDVHRETNRLLRRWAADPNSKKLQGITSHVLCSHGAKTISATSPMLGRSPADGGGLESKRHHRLEGAAALRSGEWATIRSKVPEHHHTLKIPVLPHTHEMGRLPFHFCFRRSGLIGLAGCKT